MPSSRRFPPSFIGISLALLFVLFVALTASVHAQSTQPTPVPPALEPVAVPMPASVKLTRDVTPQGLLKPSQDVTVRLRLDGQSLTGCYGAPAKPVDVIVVADISPSANNSNRLRSQQILRSLWTQMDQPIYQVVDDQARPSLSRLAIVTVDYGDTNEPRVRLPFTNSVTAINAAIDSWQSPGADTGFQKGIELASKLLTEQGRNDAQKVLIFLLHDNYYFDKEGDVLAAGKKAAASAQVFVIGNLHNITKDNAPLTPAAAELLTGSADRVFFNPSAEDLRRLFVLASGGSPTSWGRVFGITEEPAPLDLIEVQRFNIENNGRLQENRIVWSPEALASDEAGKSGEVTYHFRMAANVSATPLVLTARADFVDCNGFWHAGVDLNPLSEQIQIAAIPSTQTLTATPPGGAVPPPVSTSKPGPVGGGGQLLLRLRWLLAPLLLVLLALLLWWLWSRRPKPKPKPVSDQLRPRTLHTSSQVTNQTVLPEPETPPGKKVTSGEKDDNSALRARLQAAEEFIGQIPTTQRGFGRSPVAVRAFNTAIEMRGEAAATKGEVGLNLEAMGPSFVWQVEENGQPAKLEVTTALLQQVVDGRVTPETPLAAVWTLEPTDNAKLNLRPRPIPSTKQISIQARNTYKLPKPGQVAPEKVYWLNLRFLANPDRQSIIVQPVIETEGS